MGAMPDSARKRVVIIDDTEDLRDLLRLAMVRAGYAVVGEAEDGRTGVEVVRSERPDVVLLDLSMPVMDGLEALPPIRRLSPDAKIVVLSGFGTTQMSARAVANGADGYVQKGASLEAIVSYVKALVDGEDLDPATTAAAQGADADPATQEAPRPRALSVVPHLPDSESLPTPAPEPTVAPGAMAAPGAAPVPAAGERPAPAAGRPLSPAAASAVQALDMAPMGVLELADDPLFRIVYANPVAQRLLGHKASPGTPLAFTAGHLATQVAFHRLDADASFEVELEGGAVRASVRRTGHSVLVYFDSHGDDVGMLRRAISTTAHEIRGPVSVLCGIAETAAWDRDADPDLQRRLMASVVRQARILDAVTADLLTAAQIQRGTLRVDLHTVYPGPVADAAVAARWDTDVQVLIEDARPVRADPARLEQMIVNLVSNAAKYGQPPVSVRVRSDGPRVCIDVVDHGPGVPEEFRGELFKEFSRAQGTVATGAGLGLYVVRTLAEAMQGSVTYAPGPYGGAVFTIALLAVGD